MQPLQQRNSTLGKANIVVVVVSLQALPLSPVMTNAELLPKDDIISLFGIKSHRPFHAAVVKPVNKYSMSPGDPQLPCATIGHPVQEPRKTNSRSIKPIDIRV
jgi:hypothetical protein